MFLNKSLFISSLTNEERYSMSREAKSEEIINFFNPKYWYIENPETGTLKNQDFMLDLPSYTVDYCRYCDWGYRKRTRIWTNKLNFSPKLCLGKGKCNNMINNNIEWKPFRSFSKQRVISNSPWFS